MSEVNESEDVSVTDAPDEVEKKVDSPEQILIDGMLNNSTFAVPISKINPDIAG